MKECIEGSGKVEWFDQKPSITPEYLFLSTLFNRLNETRINYAVMRNYGMFPFDTGGSDVDIVVSPLDKEVAQKLLHVVIAEHGGVSIGLVKTRYFHQACVYGKSNDKWWGVCVELYFGVVFKGCFPLTNYEELEKTYTHYRGFVVLPESIGETLGLVKEVMIHDTLRGDKPQYLTSAREFCGSSGHLYDRIFSPLGEKGRRALEEVICGSDGTRSAAIKVFRRSVKRHALSTEACRVISSRLVHEISRFQRWLSPPGLMIAIMGVDGSGKSTLISSIEPILNSATHGAYSVMHLRPGLLPPLAKFNPASKHKDGAVTDPHNSASSGIIVSLFRLIYLVSDYIFGYWVRVRHKIAKSPAIVVFDRYVYDIFIDPRRFRISLPGRLVRLVSSMVPKPDIIICLHGRPDKICKRKQELPLAEVKRQTQALLEFARGDPRAVLISTDCTVEESRDEVLDALRKYCRHREMRG
jgi:thymidylate kinase